MHIDNYSFGNFIIDGRRYTSDIKLIGENVKFWDAEGHNMTIDDVRDAVQFNPEIIIIGTGQSGMLKISLMIREYIENKKIELITTNTPEACNLYNEMSKTRKVAAILHSTC